MKFWLEVTDRSDLGVNLHAPQTNERGKPFWSYSFIRDIRPGDCVFHYHKDHYAIVGCSRAIGEVWEDEVIWAARGTSARNAGTVPHRRVGWYLGLEGYTPIVPFLTLDQLRERDSLIETIKEQARPHKRAPAYFPFEVSEKRPIRAIQGYLFKLPAAFVAAFPQLEQAAAAVGWYAAETGLPRGDGPPEEPAPSRRVRRIARRGRLDSPDLDGPTGQEYRYADESVAISQRDPFTIDPSVVERGIQSHAATQNRLATFVQTLGCAPRSPRADEPTFDLAWEQEETIYVAEVKSITDANEERQLRLGLGQVLRYRHLLQRYNRPVVGVLVLERQPRDPDWEKLCKSVNVHLLWPETLHRLATIFPTGAQRTG